MDHILYWSTEQMGLRTGFIVEEDEVQEAVDEAQEKWKKQKWKNEK